MLFIVERSPEVALTPTAMSEQTAVRVFLVRDTRSCYNAKKYEEAAIAMSSIDKPAAFCFGYFAANKSKKREKSMSFRIDQTQYLFLHQ